MTFYLKPPRGMIPFHILQKCVEERLRYFNSPLTSVSVHGIEYLFEDSAFDRAGHFTLRLAAVRDQGFLFSFITSEVKLLELRLESYNDSLLRTFLNNLLRHAEECVVEAGIGENILAFLNAMITVASKMSSRSYRAHVFNKGHLSDGKCKFFTLNVPFQYCTTLVSRHLVDLKNGYARVSCGQWKDLLLSFFRTYLHMALNEMRYSKNTQRALEDDRIKSILCAIGTQKGNKSDSHVSLAHIDEETRYFPLCMQNLQSVLRKNHRLAHEERFNLSLFLKDIGMSVNDSIIYWKSEYSKMHAGCTNCSHNWQKEEKRYIYSIRHLYGLEGSRKTYYTRSCRYFQNAPLGPIQEGGCPFKHFDSDKLKHLLSGHLNKDSDDVNEVLLERTANPVNACKLFLTIVSENTAKLNSAVGHNEAGSSTNCDISFSNPVQYFVLMKHLK